MFVALKMTVASSFHLQILKGLTKEGGITIPLFGCTHNFRSRMTLGECKASIRDRSRETDCHRACSHCEHLNVVLKVVKETLWFLFELCFSCKEF